MFSPRVAVLALAMIPAAASAQERRRGEKDADAAFREMMKENSTGLQLSNRDVESLNPIKLLIDKKKDLKLIDDQLKQFKDFEAKLKEKNQVLFKALDSLRGASKPQAVTETDEERVRVAMVRNDVTVVLDRIRANYRASVKEAMPILNEAQQPTANELLKKQAQEGEETLRDKLSGRGGAVGGGRPGRPPTPA